MVLREAASMRQVRLSFSILSSKSELSTPHLLEQAEAFSVASDFARPLPIRL